MPATIHRPAVTSSFEAMGTTVTVAAPESEHDDARRVVEALFAEWEAELSRFRPDSELARLNASAGQPRTVGPILYAATAAALDAARVTDGLFDPLLALRMEELGYDRSFADLPPDRQRVGPVGAWDPDAWRAVILEPSNRSVTLPAGTGLDLGGIAKGMAVDAALEQLIAGGLAFAAVNAGGDLAVHGTPPGEMTWNIAVEGTFPQEVGLRSGALATSSIERRRWSVNGEERHHLIDPRNGLPSNSGLASVTVAAATCREGEVAAKVALLLGPAGGQEFLEGIGMSGLLVSTQGEAWQVGSWQ